MKNKRIDNDNQRLNDLICRLFTRLSLDAKELLEIQESLFNVKDRFDKDRTNSCLKGETLYEILKIISVVFEKKMLIDKEITDIADWISIEIGKLKDFDE